jgi:predicted amidohydrolase YtcJ
MKKRTTFNNAVFYSPESSGFNRFDMLSVSKDGVIEKKEENERSSQDTEFSDLNGGYVFPGFTDAHVHFFQTGLLLSGADYSDVFNEKNLF